MLHRLRLIPTQSADGPTNMAVDEYMLALAQAGDAIFRCYTWNPPTLSLGYFQTATERLREPAWRVLPWVRRTTGGGAILHGDDLTYALALPVQLAQKYRPADWHCRLHRFMAELLGQQGVPVQVLGGERPQPKDLGYLCFAVPQPGDVLLDGQKIIGGAQRLKHGALLQHGSMYAPAQDVMQKHLAKAMASFLGLELCEQPWSASEWQLINQIAAEKFRLADWNAKR